jgi:hypothetical protein
MKRSFLRLHFLNELSEPFIRQLVRYAGHKGAVVINLSSLAHSSHITVSALARIAGLRLPVISSQWRDCSQVHKQNSAGRAGKYTLLL